MATLYDLLKHMSEIGASDLHITVGSPPRMRVHGHLAPMVPPGQELKSLGPADTKSLCYSVLTDAQKHKFEEHNELDFSFGLKGLSRFRGNLFTQKGSCAGVFRVVPFEIKSFKQLGLPQVLVDITKKPSGLILVTGPTGSGKSTTLATMIDMINSTREDHIITVEDPIEFVHNHKKCLVNQREVTTDTVSFTAALKYVLRQDPDVVLIGELRDLETIEAALKVSETGHLTFATLHTNSAVQTINRIIDVFPSSQQEQIRVQLSFVLEGIVAQQLIPKINGAGRAMSMEILIPTQGIRNIIREDKVHQIYSAMQTGQGKYGMQTMNQSLMDLVIKKHISAETAIAHSTVPEEMQAMIQKLGSPGGGAARKR
jgi:twitching motility protein PilT